MRSQLRLKWLNCVNMTLTPRHAFKVLNPSRPGESSSYYPDHFSATTNSISSLTADTKHDTWHLSGHVSINTVNKTVARVKWIFPSHLPMVIDDQMLSLTLITILTSKPQVSLHCCVLQCYNRQPGPGVRWRYDGELDVGPGSRHLFEGDYPRVTLELRVTERETGDPGS